VKNQPDSRELPFRHEGVDLLKVRLLALRQEIVKVRAEYRSNDELASRCRIQPIGATPSRYLPKVY
jgi:hypothetical protein